MLCRLLGICALVVSLYPQTASAFCGFYVAGGDASLFNNATQVVMMRHGIRTVLSMQNNYDGPTEEFAMVVPVPVVLQQENVQTLNVELFKKIDQLSAPRLVEYWERDPCSPGWDEEMAQPPTANASEDDGDSGGVVVEAQFEVGEYEIVILSADDASGLENWLTSNNYNIPDGASEHFSPYIDAGEYFFVAKVNPEEVTFVDGRAVLSPLRFYYDSTNFSLPVKLGLINSQGTQDIIVYILAIDQRYEVANAPNVFIPTNIAVTEDVKDDFGPFYTALFAETVNQTPGSVVTEYSWNASTCDPCPGPTLDSSDYATLGADVAGAEESWGWVLTRLHARYDSDGLGDDLVFQAAGPVVGGRQVYAWDGDVRGDLEQGAESSSVNNFQGRYIIYHPWEGDTQCEDDAEPVYGQWGGPEGGNASGTAGSAMSPNSTGDDVAQEETGNTSQQLSDWLAQDLPELNIVAGSGNNGNGGGLGTKIEPGQQSSACACRESVPLKSSALWGVLLLGLGLINLRRRDS